jgi:putative Ca2+/H+ antiporter (TMEM165/GDT1 family)
MAAWSEVVVTAFLLQLLVLPGEKGQFVIAGLATRYDPYWVVAGAATAFGGWTVVEILLGEALQNVRRLCGDNSLLTGPRRRNTRAGTNRD